MSRLCRSPTLLFAFELSLQGEMHCADCSWEWELNRELCVDGVGELYAKPRQSLSIIMQAAAISSFHEDNE